MMENDIYKTASECARETKMSNIRGELEAAVKRSSQIFSRVETIAIGLLGVEKGHTLTIATSSSSEDPNRMKASIDRGSLVGLINRLRELHENMSKIERQLDRISSDL